MKYQKEERLDIGRRIYEGELSVSSAAIEYDINNYTARDYLRLYKAFIHADIPKKYRKPKTEVTINKYNPDIEKYKEMSREELIDELILAKVNEARAKKGYEVKGGGRNKQFKVINTKNMK